MFLAGTVWYHLVSTVSIHINDINAILLQAFLMLILCFLAVLLLEEVPYHLGSMKSCK